MKLNKDKHIGRVLFIVEGSQMEFSILRQIFATCLDTVILKGEETDQMNLQANRINTHR